MLTCVTAAYGLAALFPLLHAAIPEYRVVWQAGSALAHRDGSLETARFDWPAGLAVDGAGNIYVSDLRSLTVRKISVGGQVTTLAGNPGRAAFVDGQGASAQFGKPAGLAVDAAGNVFVADATVVRKITPVGVVTTIAGAPNAAGGRDGASTEARFANLYGVAVDRRGNVFVTDYAGSTIRKIDATGLVTTFAGQYHIVGAHDGDGAQAVFNRPWGLAISAAGTLYVSDLNTIRSVTPEARTTTLSSGVAIYGTQALAVDPSGNLFLAASSLGFSRVLQLSPTGALTRLAGADRPWSGYADGPGAQALFTHLLGIGLAPTGDLYVTDAGNSAIRRISSNGTVSTLAGSPLRDLDGLREEALFAGPHCGLAVSSDGTVYVADSGNQTIRVITAGGRVSTLAGKSGEFGAVDGTGAQARFGAGTAALAIGPECALYVADAVNHASRRVTRSGVVTTYAGSMGQAGSEDGSVGSARFRWPTLIASDSAGNLYVTDNGNRTIRKITVAGEVSTLAGMPGEMGTADGDRATARFVYFDGLAVDPAGNVYVCDGDFSTVRKVTANGRVTTTAGTLYARGYADGNGAAARFHYPRGLAADADGNVYVADTFNGAVRRVAPDGTVATLFQSSQDRPAKIAVDSAGNLYVATSAAVIQKMELVRLTPRITWPAPLEIPAGTALSTTQLNARADTAGTFEYDPAAGAVLSAGTHRLRVTFTPADATRYSGATAAVTLIVTERVTAPIIQHEKRAFAAGEEVALVASIAGGTSSTLQWQRNGRDLVGATGETLRIRGVQPADVGLYTVVTGKAPPISSTPAIVGLTVGTKVHGGGEELQPVDIRHPNGHVFDQVLVTGAAEAITADYAQHQITRTSFIDVDGDIVQVEFSGPGTLALVLAGAGTRAVAENYQQPTVQYMKGHAGIVIAGATEQTNVSVFTVGRATAFDPTGRFDMMKPITSANDPANNGNPIFQGHGATDYDGIADLAFIAVLSSNGKFGGIRAANANFFASQGYTGIYAPDVSFLGPVFLGDLSAFDTATPVLVLGSASDVRVTGGDLLQDNSAPVQVSGITQLKFTAGADSHGKSLPALLNRAVLRNADGADVTAQIVVNP